MAVPNVKSKTPIQDRDSWATPDEYYHGILNYLKAKGLVDQHRQYAVDVCASKQNTKHKFFYSEEQNGLVQDWVFDIELRAKNGESDIFLGQAIAWCNPPYSRGSKELFISKAIDEVKRGLDTIMLLPNDTSAQWFGECVRNAKAVIFVCNGRIGFMNNKTGKKVNGNNAGSIFVLFGHKEENKVARTLYVTKRKLGELGK